LNDLFGGATPVLASAEAGLLPLTPGAATPLIGPMVPLDALGMMGGDELSGGISRGQERGRVGTEISARVTKEDAEMPPAARADSYLWPVPAAMQPASALSAPPAFGPR
jgi:hypothetical protein